LCAVSLEFFSTGLFPLILVFSTRCNI